MSESCYWEIACNACTACRGRTVIAATRAAARRKAKGEGWRLGTPDGDLCDWCVALAAPPEVGPCARYGREDQFEDPCACEWCAAFESLTSAQRCAYFRAGSENSEAMRSRRRRHGAYGPAVSVPT